MLSLVTILSGREINNFAGQSAKSFCYNLVAMFDLFRLWLGAVLSGFRTRRSLMLENLALRQLSLVTILSGCEINNFAGQPGKVSLL